MKRVQSLRDLFFIVTPALVALATFTLSAERAHAATPPGKPTLTLNANTAFPSGPRKFNWSLFWGQRGDRWRYYINGQPSGFSNLFEINGPVTQLGPQSGSFEYPLQTGVRIEVELCNFDACTKSDVVPITVNGIPAPTPAPAPVIAPAGPAVVTPYAQPAPVVSPQAAVISWQPQAQAQPPQPQPVVDPTLLPGKALLTTSTTAAFNERREISWLMSGRVGHKWRYWANGTPMGPYINTTTSMPFPGAPTTMGMQSGKFTHIFTSTTTFEVELCNEYGCQKGQAITVLVPNSPAPPPRNPS